MFKFKNLQTKTRLPTVLWVEALRALMRAWEQGDEKGKARRLAMLEACRKQAPSEEAAALVEQNTPW